MSALRQLLSSKVRSQAGCYTCRLRRKKCDERHPECEACAALEIVCYFDGEKPEWMDGGRRQKEMAETIKAQVKKQASQRRDRKYLDMLESGRMQTVPGLGDGGDDTISNSKTSEPDRVFSGTSASGSGPSNKTSPGSTGPVSTEAPWHSQLWIQQQGDIPEDSGPDADIHYACIYLDYVFPHMFPHYLPSALAGGRGWVLDTLQRTNKSLYYITMSLSAYYFSVIMANGDLAHKECTNRMNDKLQTQMQLGLRELQKEVCVMNRDGNPQSQEGHVVLQSILQMLMFEVSTNHSENWKMHLDAAIALFRQILPDPGDWAGMLQGLYTTRWPPPEMGLKRPWSTTQAACRFFTANLLYIDILSSVTLGCTPRLHAYQSSIIPECAEVARWIESTQSGPLSMEEFRGLYNWVIAVIGDIAAMHSWKKSQSLAGCLSIPELVNRGKILSDAIKGNLNNLEMIYNPADELSANLVSLHITGNRPNFTAYNIIWLNAAMIYLNTVISGWQPSSPEIQHYVSKTTDLLYNLPRDNCLRSMAWPLCIAGCLAQPQDEIRYREMVSRLGPLHVFGTVNEAFNVMQAAWARRPLEESWDMAQCMNILGHGVLLI